MAVTGLKVTSAMGDTAPGAPGVMRDPSVYSALLQLLLLLLLLLLY
jgi:hypothetical protein